MFIGILVLFSAFLIPYYYYKNQRIFEYEGLIWQIDKDGDVTFYWTQFNKTINNQTYGLHNTFFRNDPRRNNIPIDVQNYAFYKNITIITTYNFCYINTF